MSVQMAYQYDLFISYADADRAWVEGYLAGELEDYEYPVEAVQAALADLPVVAG